MKEAMSAMAAEKTAAKSVRTEPDLVAKGLVKVYGDRTVVNGMDVSCSCGESVGLLGPNGAGKTTTFYMVVGLVPPAAGTVTFRGEDITYLPVYKRARKGLGYLAQEASIFRKLSVWDNVMAILETMPMSRQRRKERAVELLEPFDLMKVAKQPAYTLSGGERRKLEIARALVRDSHARRAVRGSGSAFGERDSGYRPPSCRQRAWHHYYGPQCPRDAFRGGPRIHGVQRPSLEGGNGCRACSGQGCPRALLRRFFQNVGNKTNKKKGATT